MIHIVHFADLHMGVENYGAIDPGSGLSTCLMEFQASLDEVVDFVLQNDTDLVLFSGDAYKSRDPSQTHQREFASRIGRLAAAGIKVFLLVGNHDLPNAMGRATAVEIFDTLAIENVIVADRPGVHNVDTRRGRVQVVAVPWARRGALVAGEDTRGLAWDEIKRRSEEALSRIVADEARQLDGSSPAILSAHASVANAALGSERAMILGQDPVVPLASVALPCFDYVAMGHIHRHQVLCHDPPVVYPGSLQRIDFSDEDDTKGFYELEIDPQRELGKRATFEFHPTKARRFLTIESTVASEDAAPTATILRDIARRAGDARGAIVRLQIAISEGNSHLVREDEVRRALSEAQCVSIAKKVDRERRIRLSGWPVEEMSPAGALKVYLEQKIVTAERLKTLLEYGESLVREVMSGD